MPVSSTERFARTYTPRLPDDGYDSLGVGVTDWVVKPPPELPVQRLDLAATFASGALAITTLVAGQRARLDFVVTLSSASLSSLAIKAAIQTDKVNLSVTMAGGTLK